MHARLQLLESCRLAIDKRDYLTVDNKIALLFSGDCKQRLGDFGKLR
jgi:hypothetical protein